MALTNAQAVELIDGYVGGGDGGGEPAPPDEPPFGVGAFDDTGGLDANGLHHGVCINVAHAMGLTQDQVELVLSNYLDMAFRVVGPGERLLVGGRLGIYCRRETPIVSSRIGLHPMTRLPVQFAAQPRTRVITFKLLKKAKKLLRDP